MVGSCQIFAIRSRLVAAEMSPYLVNPRRDCSAVLTHFTKSGGGSVLTFDTALPLGPGVEVEMALVAGVEANGFEPSGDGWTWKSLGSVLIKPTPRGGPAPSEGTSISLRSARPVGSSRPSWCRSACVHNHRTPPLTFMPQRDADWNGRIAMNDRGYHEDPPARHAPGRTYGRSLAFLNGCVDHGRSPYRRPHSSRPRVSISARRCFTRK